MTTPPAPFPHRALMVTLLVVALLANAVVGGLLIWTRATLSDYVRCTSAYNQQFAAAYAARVAAAEPVSNATDQVIRSAAAAIAGEDAEGEAFAEALTEYVEVRNQQDKDRRRNPLPPLPQTLCGNPE